MIPYHDENRTLRTAWVTLVLVAVTVSAWIVVQGAGATMPLATAVCNLGLIPGELTLLAPAGSGLPMGDRLLCVTDPGRQSYTLFTSMFLHGSWMHLIGNMWFLWLFGNNVEDSMTRPRFLAFYLLCGLAAAMAQVLSDPASVTPMVGASGAISGVMGAYLVLFPRVRVFTLVPLGFFMYSMALPAWAMLIYWMVLQVFGGLISIGSEDVGGVAFWAHVGGFVAGVVLVRMFRQPDRALAHATRQWRPERATWR